MEYLHAHWRMEYMNAPKAYKEDLFSELPKTEDDKSVYILWRGPLSYIVMNIYPYNVGHLLAIPYRKVANLVDLTDSEQVALISTITIAQKILDATLKPHGYNIGLNLGSAAGAGIPSHIHAHIVPRWTGDSNFMPVLGHTRVISRHLDSLWDQLYPVAQTFK